MNSDWRPRPRPIRSGTPARAAAIAGRRVRSSIHTLRKRFCRSSLASRIKLTPRLNSEPACSKYIVSKTLGSAASRSFARLVGGAINVTRPPADTDAMARTNGRCQITSPMPRFAWMTAVRVLTAAPARDAAHGRCNAPANRYMAGNSSNTFASNANPRTSRASTVSLSRALLPTQSDKLPEPLV